MSSNVLRTVMFMLAALLVAGTTQTIAPAATPHATVRAANGPGGGGGGDPNPCSNDPDCLVRAL
jgi:hypothetical protein